MAVSIPSERESALQALHLFRLNWSASRLVSIPSERESALQEIMQIIKNVMGAIVSIPSERESALQVRNDTEIDMTTAQFQFPPNGKVLCKFHNTTIKFEGALFSFNSLRTGKCFASCAMTTARVWEEF